mmetsp:Transcript_73676/g.239922  ORF Transcript_73676/g.239922 Transcript_73676/m.239922 type:complete len:321 (+) Transcript_73676:1141-2103(+)
MAPGVSRSQPRSKASPANRSRDLSTSWQSARHSDKLASLPIWPSLPPTSWTTGALASASSAPPSWRSSLEPNCFKRRSSAASSCSDRASAASRGSAPGPLDLRVSEHCRLIVQLMLRRLRRSPLLVRAKACASSGTSVQSLSGGCRRRPPPHSGERSRASTMPGNLPKRMELRCPPAGSRTFAGDRGPAPGERRALALSLRLGGVRGSAMGSPSDSGSLLSEASVEEELPADCLGVCAPAPPTHAASGSASEQTPESLFRGTTSSPSSRCCSTTSATPSLFWDVGGDAGAPHPCGKAKKDFRQGQPHFKQPTIRMTESRQ